MDPIIKVFNVNYTYNRMKQTKVTVHKILLFASNIFEYLHFG
jgi:hypothetical protein